MRISFSTTERRTRDRTAFGHESGRSVRRILFGRKDCSPEIGRDAEEGVELELAARKLRVARVRRSLHGPDLHSAVRKRTNKNKRSFGNGEF